MKERVLLPTVNPVLPTIFEIVAPESTGVVTSVTVDEAEFIVTLPPFVVLNPLIVKADNAVVLLTCTVTVYCCVYDPSEVVTEKEIVLFPVTNQVSPEILDNVVLASLAIATTETDVVP